jgi:hypothetical protein
VTNQNGKRRVVVVIRERNGETLPAVFNGENASLKFIRERVAPGTILNADEATSWNELHALYAVNRINHQEVYSDGFACTNWAESFFSRMRRGEIGHHHHLSGAYLVGRAQEMAWREDHRRSASGDQFGVVVKLVTKNPPSIDFCGYWQRNQRAA